VLSSEISISHSGSPDKELVIAGCATCQGPAVAVETGVDLIRTLADLCWESTVGDTCELDPRAADCPDDMCAYRALPVDEDATPFIAEARVLPAPASVRSVWTSSSDAESSPTSNSNLFASQSSSGTLGSKVPLLASASAPSFPSIPACPSTYCTWTLNADEEHMYKTELKTRWKGTHLLASFTPDGKKGNNVFDYFLVADGLAFRIHPPVVLPAT
jgi:hypothetical protein